jgi:hypothetical protein
MCLLCIGGDAPLRQRQRLRPTRRGPGPLRTDRQLRFTVRRWLRRSEAISFGSESMVTVAAAGAVAGGEGVGMDSVTASFYAADDARDTISELYQSLQLRYLAPVSKCFNIEITMTYFRVDIGMHVLPSRYRYEFSSISK